MAAPRPDAASPDSAGEANAAKLPAAAGLQAWLPLLAAVVLMPLMAYAVTTFLLIPKLQRELSPSSATPETAPPPPAHGHQAAPAKPTPGSREQVAFSKLLVNVAGTMGSRLLMTSLTLVGTAPDLKNRIARNEAQLRDTACGILGTKTLADLEKPGARNILRSELVTAFNNVFGETVVQEIYFTEFAIQ